MPCDAICLDAGATLVWPNWHRISRVFADHGIAVDPGSLAAADPRVRRLLDTEAIVSASTDRDRGLDYFARVLTSVGVTLSGRADAALAELAAYQRTMNVWEHVPDFVSPALQELRRRGYRLAVVSNANGTVRRAFRRLGLLDLVDVVIDSAEEGFEKPDRRLFDVALERLGSKSETTIHVGDIYHVDVVGARAAGMTPVLIDEADLYPEADCHRIASIAELPALLADSTGPLIDR